MAQDDRKGPPSTHGRSPATSAPDTADSLHIKAPAGPEAPETESEPEPVDAAAGQDTVDAGESGGGSGGDGASAGSTGGASESKELQDKIDKAKRELEVLKAQLALAEDRRKTEEATTKMVGDYDREKPALTAIEEELKQYRHAEISFLSQFLDDAQRKGIADASAAEQRKIDELPAEIETKAKAAADKRAELDSARTKAAEAKAEAEALKRPAASIRDRLKAADAIRAEAKKASDSGDYALAYWLVMNDGRLDKKVKAKPRVIPASDLETAVRKSAADQAKAEQKVAALEGEVKAAETALQADRAELARLKAGFEATVRSSLAKFNPKSPEAA